MYKTDVEELRVICNDRVERPALPPSNRKQTILYN